MNPADKIKSAIEIFKAKLPEARGKFRAYASHSNANEVDIHSEDGLYCIINVKSRTAKAI